MNRSARVIATVALAAVVVGSGMGVAGAAASMKSKGPKIKLRNACTIISPQQAAKAFGGPSHPKVAVFGINDCNYPVGTDPTMLPGGTVSTEVLFPSSFVIVPDAKAAVEDAHAIDTLSKYQLTDVEHLGVSAYVNLTKGVLTVAANKHYAFSVSWHPASVTYGEITDVEAKKLIALAKDVVKRAPR